MVATAGAAALLLVAPQPPPHFSPFFFCFGPKHIMEGLYHTRESPHV